MGQQEKDSNLILRETSSRKEYKYVGNFKLRNEVLYIVSCGLSYFRFSKKNKEYMRSILKLFRLKS